MATPYGRDNIVTSACTYAINGKAIDACETLETQSTIVNDIVNGSNVNVTTETKNSNKDEYVYVRNDRVRQATFEANVAKEQATFVIDQFNPVVPGMV